MDLQHAFYIIGIIFMSVMLLLVMGILTAILVIKSKVNTAHQAVSDKIDSVKNLTSKGAFIIRTARRFVKM